MQPQCPRCGPVAAIRGGACWYCGQPVTDTHIYYSTACLHDHHDYCQSETGGNATNQTWNKTPATCKFCDAPCTCHCHHEDT